MKIAFLHYHLKTGGVTTVLKGQIAALQGVCDVLVLTGDRAGTVLPCDVIEIPELGYDLPGSSPPPPEIIADKVLKSLSHAWPGGCDVLHVHNPTLAKNRQFLRILKRLQQSGINLFLQIHDFSEDGRPGVYFWEDYPANCHYGIINARDGRMLIEAGLDASGVHLIPNPILPLSIDRNRRPKPFVLYPVRAIRRKNIGEAILLSLFLKNGHHLALTQPPNSPSDLQGYHDWKAYVDNYRMKVVFEAGKAVDFSDLLGAAAWMLTTSIAEGFGFSFLEPWTVGKVLWGRRLKDICEDFEGNGVRLNHLYDRLNVPLDWFDADAFSRKWHATVLGVVDTYGHTVAPDVADRRFAGLTRGGLVDFGILNETFQRQILSRLIGDPSARLDLVSLNAWLAQPGTVSDASAMIEANCRAVARHYSLEKCRYRLLEIYEKVIHHPVCHRIDKRMLLDAFFDIERFSLLKWSPYDG
jgi:glycosyltransferase involved in cell wall biosynthesis